MESGVDKVQHICDEVKKVVFGKDEVIEKVLMAVLAQGHVLIDDVPGVGKTTLATAFARAMGLEQKRMQFTPDVLPSDVMGYSIYNKENGKFEYRQGAVMCNLFLGDEINRTSPKTQSALLEVMEEGFVTVDSIRHEVPKPFVVIATENPAGSVGTQRLPESQMDRFMIKIGMGYPSVEDEVRVIQGKRFALIESVNEVITKDELIRIQQEVKNVYMEESLCVYIARIAQATRQDEAVQLGISPRGSVALASMAKASAYMSGRNYAIPDDIKKVAFESIEHRIILNAKSKVNRVSETEVIKRIIATVKVPTIKPITQLNRA